MRIVIFLTMLPKRQQLCYYYNMNRQDELMQSLAVQFDNKKDVLLSIMNSWKMGLTTSQAAVIAGVPRRTLRDWIDNNEEFRELREMCQEEMNTLARKNIHKAIKKGSVETSKWFLERTDPEFSKKDQNAAVQVNIVSVADRESELKKFMERFTDAGVIDTVITEERDVCPVGEGEDTPPLQEGKCITG